MERITHAKRREVWRQIIEQCQARPAGQTAEKWLTDNNVNRTQYYYWLRKDRHKAVSKAHDSSALSPASETKTSEIAFAELPFHPDTTEEVFHPDTLGEEEAFRPAAIIKTATALVAFSNDVSHKLLLEVLQEVMRHA